MGNPLISIIVPVYKTEPYLERCVNSIRNQTYQNLEIILVDDGSPDRCGEMCDALAKEDSRIRVIHKENGGLSSARNAGLDAMTGEYVGFVDSDDWIDPEMYEVLYCHLENSQSQIAGCVIRLDSPKGEVLHYFLDKDPGKLSVCIFEMLDALKELIRSNRITNSVCDKLFCKECFSQRRFTVGIVNEDFEMMPKLVSQIQRFVFVPNSFYHYVMTNESITRGEFKESRFTETNISRAHLKFYSENYPSLYFEAVAKHIEIALVLIYFSGKDSRFEFERERLIREIRSMFSFSAIRCMSKKEKIKYLSFMISVRLYTHLMDCFSTGNRG